MGGVEGNKDRCQQMCLSNTLGMEKIATLQNCHEDTIKELIAGNNLILNTNEMNCLS